MTGMKHFLLILSKSVSAHNFQNKRIKVRGEKCEYGEFKFTHNCIDCVMSFNW